MGGFRHKLQWGLHCTNCQEDIYSNSRNDYVTCHCGWWWVDGGFEDFRIGGTGEDIASHVYISRLIEDPKSLPVRYRDEVPERREVAL